MRKFIFADVESTGLDPDQDELVELTYATRHGEPQTLWFGVQAVPPFIDNLIGFTKRGLAGRRSDNFKVQQFLQESEGATLVGANPGFDKGFLEKSGLWRFHYRMLDIESYAMAKLNLNEVPGMKNIYDILTERGYTLVEPDHTSRNDVLALRQAFHILETM